MKINQKTLASPLAASTCLFTLLIITLLASPTAFSQEADVVVTLSTGEKIQGQLIEQKNDTLTLYHPILGRLNIPADKITTVETNQQAVTADPQKTDEPMISPVAASAVSPKPQKTPKPEIGTLFEGWESNLELGFNGSNGNTETLNIYFGFDSEKKTPTDVWKVDATYFLNSTEGETSKNELDSGLRREWLKVDSPWFVFVQGRFDVDEFARYDYRLTGNGGLGYDVIVQENFQLNVLGGLGAAKEFNSPEDELRPEALAGFELEWAIKKGHKLTADTLVYPDLSDFQKFRVQSNAAWVIKLGDTLNTSLKLGVKNEYESHVGGTTKRNDIKYYGAVILGF